MLPAILLSRLQDILGKDYQHVMDAFSGNRIGSLRINTLKAHDEEVIQEYAQKSIPLIPFPSLQHVYTFDRQYEYTLKWSDAFYSGKVYLQSLSSLLPALILAPQAGMRILDVCSAPGSKTTQIASLIHNQGEIVAIEPGKIRYDRLVYNLKLQGANSVHAIRGDAREVLAREHIGSFDAILLDAPCSAEGRIFLQNTSTYGFWSEENTKKKSLLQTSLLHAAWSRLAPWGRLVYATCTLAPEENEAIVSDLLFSDKNAVLIPIDAFQGMEDVWRHGMDSFRGKSYHPSLHEAVRILPSRTTEWFFLALIHKAA